MRSLVRHRWIAVSPGANAALQKIHTVRASTQDKFCRRCLGHHQRRKRERDLNKDALRTTKLAPGHFMFPIALMMRSDICVTVARVSPVDLELIGHFSTQRCGSVRNVKRKLQNDCIPSVTSRWWDTRCNWAPRTAMIRSSCNGAVSG